jgi:hypothetical protein
MRRFGDPATIREEPMLLFAHPDAVRDVFRLDPAVAPAGQSWGSCDRLPVPIRFCWRSSPSESWQPGAAGCARSSGFGS